MRIHLLVTTLILAPSLMAASDPPAAPRAYIVLDRTLTPHEGFIESLKDGSIRLRLLNRETIDLAKPVAFVRADNWSARADAASLPKPAVASSETKSTIELVDGSRLSGDLIAGKGEQLFLIHPNLGRVEFSLDTLRSVSPHSTTALLSTEPAKADVVRFANGDRLEGLVTAIHPVLASSDEPSTVSIETCIEGNNKTSTIDLAGVRSIHLANPIDTKKRPLIWLADGSVSTAARLTIERDEARAARSSESLAATFATNELAGALLVPDALVRLDECEVTAGRAVLRVGNSVSILGSRDLTVVQPGTCEWILPAGASRMSGWLMLPDSCRVWGDCDVVLSLVNPDGRTRELFKQHLDPVVPEAPFTLDIQGDARATLRLTLGEGRFGPIQDQIILRRVLIAK